MPIISNSLFEGLADRLAEQADIISTAFTDAQQEGGGFFYPRIHSGVASLGDFAVEDSLIKSANELDGDTLSGSTFSVIFADVINAHQSHVVAEGSSDLNQFLNVSGINVDVYYEEVFFQTKGSHLEGRNVFLDRQIDLGTVDITSSGVGTFTVGEALGIGAGAVSQTNHAAAVLDAIPTAAITADLILAVQLQEEVPFPGDGERAASRNVTITSGVLSGVPTEVGTGGEVFLDVTDVIIAGGGASDQVIVRSRIDRLRAL